MQLHNRRGNVFPATYSRTNIPLTVLAIDDDTLERWELRAVLQFGFISITKDKSKERNNDLLSLGGLIHSLI